MLRPAGPPTGDEAVAVLGADRLHLAHELLVHRHGLWRLLLSGGGRDGGLRRDHATRKAAVIGLRLMVRWPMA